MTGRYVVESVYPDGHPCEPEGFDALGDAQTAAARREHEHRTRGWRSAVIVTDTEDPERGDVSGVESEED